ncbi:hypothetical protein [uncultured Methanolobus sp.]|uniref:hypothetical protein n=1 Tax=uncultured Methanolobus sp. TaxID=218300 RepID=UPI0029C874B6|nr:hypothetical protein [uncultured Methanolobus sp.]
MTKIDNAADLLEEATIELTSLQKHWNSLAWWERNMSLENVFDLIFDIKMLPEYVRRCGIIEDKAEELDVLNMADYPSDEALANDTGMELYYEGNPRLCQGHTYDLLQSLSDDDIKSIAARIDIDESNPRECLIEVMGCSMSSFYAVRNTVGEVIKVK